MRQIEKLGNLYKKTHQSGMVYSVNGICPALCGGCHSYGIPFVLVKSENSNHDSKTYIIYDDYNGRIRKDQNTIGTLTTNVGNDAMRNGFKLIEICGD